MGRVIQTGLAAVLQSLIMVGLALAVGAHFPGGVAGLIVLIVAAILLSMGFGSLSNGLALLLRREESVIAASNFILLPLTFLSSAFLQQNLAPHWIQVVAAYNPVNWAIEAGRGALAPTSTGHGPLSPGLPAGLHGRLRVALDEGLSVLSALGLSGPGSGETARGGRARMRPPAPRL